MFQREQAKDALWKRTRGLGHGCRSPKNFPHATARVLRLVENRAFHAFIYAFSKRGIRVLAELGPHEM